MNPQPKAVISAILFKKEKGEPKFFVQTRWKPEHSPQYSGLVEIPAGGIDSYENAYDALYREVKEETNLDIIRIVDDNRGELLSTREGDEGLVFKPFVCQQVTKSNGGLPWIGFVFLCEVEGEVKIQESEARDPKWLNISELENILNEKENIFILQYPVMKYFAEQFKSGNVKL